MIYFIAGIFVGVVGTIIVAGVIYLQEYNRWYNENERG
jgi:hypothetical protein